MNIESLYQKFLTSKGVCTDTRKIEAGQLFFALKGGNFNGNLYAQQALNKGASCVVIDEVDDKVEEHMKALSESEKNDKYFVVSNVLETLQDLANHHRKQLTIPFIAITGSNGKTTSKELVKAVLSTTYKTIATKGNLNNHIGVPLTLLTVGQEHEMAIIEMGANHPIEINQLCKIAQPNFGLITNIGSAHLEGFGSLEGVQKAKGELFEFLEAFGGRCFVNMNDYKVAELAYFIQKATTYGTGKFFNTNGRVQECNPFLSVIWQPKKPGKAAPVPDPVIINTQLIGQYNLDNVLAAITVGLKFKVSPENIKAGIEAYQPKNNRSQIVKLAGKGGNGDGESGGTVILDAYNANPSSMEAALENLAAMTSTNKVAILGDMLELGKYSQEEHQKMVEKAQSIGLKLLVLVGNEFAAFKDQADLYFSDSTKAQEWFVQQDFSNTTILIKGSRGIALEKLLG